MNLPRRTLGKTGEEVTALGLGGEGVLRTFGREEEAYRVIRAASDAGLRYFESARAYSGSEAYLGQGLQGFRDQIFLTSKSHGRSRAEAEEHLDTTLKNLQTDKLDLWQVHDVRTREDLEAIGAPGGALGLPPGPRSRERPGSSGSPATTIRRSCGWPWRCTNSTPCSCRSTRRSRTMPASCPWPKRPWPRGWG